MARLSRLLSAVSLGIAATAAIGAAVAAVEYAPVHRTPRHLAEQAGEARVIVKFKDTATTRTATLLSASGSKTGVSGPQRAGALGTRLGLALADGRVLGERTQVMMASGMTSAALVASLARDSEVEWAQVDHRRFIQAVAPVNDPLYPDGVSTSIAPTGPASGQWYLRAPGIDSTGRNVVSSINIEPAWAITHGSSAIVIGDVDTGITQHPDLDSKILTGYDFVGYGENDNTNRAHALAIANDGDLNDPDPSDPGDYVTAAENSDKNGYFYACNDSDSDTPGQPVFGASSWHGTETAGILGAATNNGQGIAGTAYDVKVIPTRALGKCGGYDSDIIAAAQWAAGISVSGVSSAHPNANPARVINMSLGGSGVCATDAPAYVDALTALRNKGVFVVAAAGNDAGLPVDVPANCKPAASDPDQTPIVIAVAGLRHAGTKVGFSDIGTEVTLAAPGGNCINTTAGSPCLYAMVTTRNTGTMGPDVNGGTYSDAINNPSLGTSFSTPLVTGTVALMLSAAPTLTNREVIAILQSTARPFPTVSDTVPNPAVCTVPIAEVDDSKGNVITPGSAPQDECICTTSTCGAGMLDAGRAVAMAVAVAGGAAPIAIISPTTASVVAGTTVTLSGTGSTVGFSGTALTYKWSIPDADTAITLGSNTSSNVVVTGLTAGTGQVQLTVTDPGNGMTASQTINVTVTAAASTGGGSSSGGGGGGGGGGAANPLWLAALAIAGLLLGPRTRRSRR